MKVTTNTSSFTKQMNNIVEYSMGFLEGAQNGKKVFINNLGAGTIQALSAYVDMSAKANPKALHHIYEWYQTGSPSARLFDLSYTSSNLGLSITSRFRQSKTISQGSHEPFANKASIMENGTPITINPSPGSVLVFKDSGQTIFTKRPVVVRNPGGNVDGKFEKTVDEFILKYFKQSFLRASGVYEYIKKPVIYKKNILAGSKSGRSTGVSTGFKWIANAKVGVE